MKIILVLALSATAFAQTGTLIVINQKQHAVDFVDPHSKQLLTAVSVGVNGHEIALSKDARTAYVPIYSNTGVGKPGTNGQFIDVLDLEHPKVVREIDLGHPVRPHKPLLGPDGLLYVTAELDHAVDIVDPTSGKVVGQIPTGSEASHIFTATPDWTRGYTANVTVGSVSALDIKKRTLIRVIPLTKHVQRIVTSVDGRWAFTSDWDQPRVAVLDTKSNELKQWIPVDGVPYVTQPTPDGKWLVVAAKNADEKAGILNIVDLKSMQVVRKISTDAFIVSFLAHDGLMYGSCGGNGNVEILNIHVANPAAWNLETPIHLAPGVDAMAWTSVVPVLP
jgi:DNA-binding beta-propeller fold protein YncE